MPLKKKGAYIQATLYGITSDIQGIQDRQETGFMTVNSMATPVKTRRYGNFKMAARYTENTPERFSWRKVDVLRGLKCKLY